jgi:hypothetical protein
MHHFSITRYIVLRTDISDNSDYLPEIRKHFRDIDDAYAFIKSDMEQYSAKQGIEADFANFRVYSDSGEGAVWHLQPLDLNLTIG